jgi:hypothetical protein
MTFWRALARKRQDLIPRTSYLTFWPSLFDGFMFRGHSVEPDVGRATRSIIPCTYNSVVIDCTFYVMCDRLNARRMFSPRADYMYVFFVLEIDHWLERYWLCSRSVAGLPDQFVKSPKNYPKQLFVKIHS